jgi:hypothetical protein
MMPAVVAEHAGLPGRRLNAVAASIHNLGPGSLFHPRVTSMRV